MSHVCTCCANLEDVCRLNWDKWNKKLQWSHTWPHLEICIVFSLQKKLIKARESSYVFIYTRISFSSPSPVVMSVGSLSTLPLWLSGANTAGESAGWAGNAEPTHGAAGEQLQGVGTLTWPVEQEITGQHRSYCSLSSFCLCFEHHRL